MYFFYFSSVHHNKYLIQFLIRAGRIGRSIENDDPNVKSEDDDGDYDSSDSDSSDDYLMVPV